MGKLSTKFNRCLGIFFVCTKSVYEVVVQSFYNCSLGKNYVTNLVTNLLANLGKIFATNFGSYELEFGRPAASWLGPALVHGWNFPILSTDRQSMLHSDGAKLHGVSIGGSRLAICSTSTWFVISAMPGRCLWLKSTWTMWSAEDLVRVIDKTRKVIMRVSNPAFAWRFMRAVSISSGSITKTTMSEFAAQPRVAPANLAWWLSVMLHWVFLVKKPEGWYFILQNFGWLCDVMCFFFFFVLQLWNSSLRWCYGCFWVPAGFLAWPTAVRVLVLIRNCVTWTSTMFQRFCLTALRRDPTDARWPKVKN